MSEAGNHQTVRVAAGFSTISAHCGQPDARSREVTGPDNGEWPPLIGRAGASPPSRTAAIIYICVVRRALNVLRSSFSPIFQYFSAVNITRVSFSQVFQYFVTYVRIYLHACHAPRNCIVGHGFFDLEFVRHGFVRHGFVRHGFVSHRCRCCCTCR